MGICHTPPKVLNGICTYSVVYIRVNMTWHINVKGAYEALDRLRNTTQTVSWHSTYCATLRLWYGT